MHFFARHWRRMAVTLIPVLLALLHATGWWHMALLQQLDNLVYDTRLRATMPRTLDPRIVVVDINEPSLAEVGHWPWGRDTLAQLSDELFVRQKATLVGFDVLFAEPDTSSGLKTLQKLAQGALRDQPGFVAQVQGLQPQLDFDARFAKALDGRNAVLGYYFTSDRDGHTRGVLPAPVMDAAAMHGVGGVTVWTGYGANIAPLAQAAPQAGFFNAITDADGVVRSVPLVAQYQGQYYESLALALFRRLLDLPAVSPGLVPGASAPAGLASIQLKMPGQTLAIPVDSRAAALVPFRGLGGPKGGSFSYVSAADVVAGRLPAGSLAGKVVLVGTTAPGLLDVRTSPVGEVFPGVEVHANMLSGLMDGTQLARPDYASGFEVLVLVLAGVLLALVLPLLSATGAVLFSGAVLAVLVGLNLWLYLSAGLVLPLASMVTMVLAALALNMGYGYLVESRAKRKLADLFGTYVPPELVDEMVRNPDRYSMQAQDRELTVMFCDMRGFTRISEQMEPTQLQTLLNGVFSRLTAIIRAHRGTIDKYMGDCVMAFWGAPVETPDHAHLAVKAALEMARALQGMPAQISMGIGLSTGVMRVGDMGSDIRRSYTVIGDAVNLGSRLEGLCATYGVAIVASGATRNAAPAYLWQELDTVRVKGKDAPLAIYTPLGLASSVGLVQKQALDQWNDFLSAYRAQDWVAAEQKLVHMRSQGVNYFLCVLYADRVALMRSHLHNRAWDGSTHLETP